MFLLMVLLCGIVNFAYMDNCEIVEFRDEQLKNGYPIELPRKLHVGDVINKLTTKNVQGIINDPGSTNFLKADFSSSDNSISISVERNPEALETPGIWNLDLKCADDSTKSINLHYGFQVFGEPLYLVTYSKNMITVQNPKIIGNSNIERKDFSFGDAKYGQYFEMELVTENEMAKSINLSIRDKLPVDFFHDNVLLLDIILENTELVISSRTTIIIRNVHESIFTKSVYTAKYNVEDGIKLDESITITSEVENPSVTLKDHNESYFSVSVSSGELKFTKNSPLPEDMLKSPELVLIIEASHAGFDVPDVTVLVVRLPKSKSYHPPIFSKNVYTATYSVNKGIQINGASILIEMGMTSETKVQVTSEYEQYFRAKVVNVETGEIDIEVIQDPLPNGILQKNHILIEMIATNPGIQSSGITTVLLSIVNENLVHPPEFGKHFYYGTYDFEGIISLNDPLTIVYGLQADTVFDVADFSRLFEVTIKDPTSGKLVIKRTNISQTPLFEGTKRMVIEIKAENPGLTILSGTTALILERNAMQGSEQCYISLASSEDGYFILLLITILIILVMVSINAGLIVVLRKQRMQAMNAVPTWTKTSFN